MGDRPGKGVEENLVDGGDVVEEREAFEAHRTKRFSSQRATCLPPSYTGPTPDPYLSPNQPLQDARHGISLVVRPPLLPLLSPLQATLASSTHSFSSRLWLTPPQQLHLTLLEVTHSEPSLAALQPLLSSLRPSLPAISKSIKTSKIILDSPQLSYDSGGIAITFLPSPTSSSYLSLRSALLPFTKQSRYLHPSAHITLARFSSSFGKREEWLDLVRVVDGINEELRKEWKEEKWCWRLGEEEGRDERIECRAGLVWYGGGELVEAGGID